MVKISVQFDHGLRKYEGRNFAKKIDQKLHFRNILSKIGRSNDEIKISVHIMHDAQTNP